MDQNALIECRVEPANNAAIVFIHGGSGDPRETWGNFPHFIAQDPRANGWDIYSYGYISTGINWSLGMPLNRWLKRRLGVSVDPSVAMLVNGLHTRLTTGRFADYAALTIVAHSLGGIVAQKMLVEYADMRTRVQFVFLMGVSSNGFVDKLYTTHNMAQIAEIRPGTPLIVDLRDKWKRLFIDRPAPFEYWAIAGDQDGFVPPDSSLAPFPQDRCRVIPGDHGSIKEPRNASDQSVQFVLERLVGQLGGDRWGGARMAVELGEYQQAIARLEPHVNDLDEAGLTTLALAYESVGRTDDALSVLSHSNKYANATDALGVLAGRLKRRWYLNRTASDGTKAIDLYLRAYQLATDMKRADQICYHGINVAFMQLAYRNDLAAAARTAQSVLACCDNATADYWNLATRAEAHLYLLNTQAALDTYRKALACEPPPLLRQRQSTFEQAMRVVACLPALAGARRALDKTFR